MVELNVKYNFLSKIIKDFKSELSVIIVAVTEDVRAVCRDNFLWSCGHYFLLFQTHYHTLPYAKTKEKKILTKDKIEPQRMKHLRKWQISPSILGPVLCSVSYF